MKIIQVTDLHLRTDQMKGASQDPMGSFKRALADISKRHSEADLMVLTGDLTEHGEAVCYQMLRRVLEEVEIPTALLIGNHDDRMQFSYVFPEAIDGEGFVQGARDLPLGRALFVDTSEPGCHYGTLCDLRLAWLEAELSATAGPFWIFMHHNPIPTHLKLIDRIMLQDRDGFRELIKRFRTKIAYIFHGHLHLPMSGSLAGVPVHCPRGTSHAGYPNYGDDRLLPMSGLPASYSVIISDGIETTVMMVEYAAEPEG
ncbi:MAG: metallophosphoesterase [Pseudomonadota bacterium]